MTVPVAETLAEVVDANVFDQPYGISERSPSWHGDLSVAFRPPSPASDDSKLVKQTLSHLRIGSDGDISEAELLAALLCFGLGARTAAKAATKLLATYGTVRAVLQAPHGELSRHLQSSDSAATLLVCVSRLLAASLRTTLTDRPVFPDMQSVMRYLAFEVDNFSCATIRTFYVDHDNMLLDEEVSSIGGALSVSVYTRQIVRKMLVIRAAAVILVKTLPGGKPKISEDERRVFAELQSFLGSVNLSAHDYCVLSNSEFISIHGSKGSVS